MILPLLLLAASACHKDRSDQNLAIDNSVQANAPTDVDVLPPDETSTDNDVPPAPAGNAAAPANDAQSRR